MKDTNINGAGKEREVIASDSLFPTEGRENEPGAAYTAGRWPTAILVRRCHNQRQQTGQERERDCICYFIFDKRCFRTLERFKRSFRKDRHKFEQLQNPWS